MQEIARRDGVELRRRLVEQQHARLHDERRGKRQQLLAAARKRIRIAVEPRPHAKEVARLGNTTAHLALGRTEVFQAECHLVPHAVAHDLVIGVLEHIADLTCCGPVQVIHGSAEHAHLAGAVPRRGDLRLGQREQRRLARTGASHQQRERTGGNGHGHAAQYVTTRARIAKRHVIVRERDTLIAHANTLLSYTCSAAGTNIQAA